MLTELELSKKREKKNLKRRSTAAAKARARASYDVGYRRRVERLNAEELARRAEAYEAARATSKAAVVEGARRRRQGFFDSAKDTLRAMLPRRTGGAD